MRGRLSREGAARPPRLPCYYPLGPAIARRETRLRTVWYLTSLPCHGRFPIHCFTLFYTALYTDARMHCFVLFYTLLSRTGHTGQSCLRTSQFWPNWPELAQTGQFVLDLVNSG